MNVDDLRQDIESEADIFLYDVDLSREAEEPLLPQLGQGILATITILKQLVLLTLIQKLLLQISISIW